MIDNIVVPVASVYGLSDDYKYLKSSIREFLTGLFSIELKAFIQSSFHWYMLILFLTFFFYSGRRKILSDPIYRC